MRLISNGILTDYKGRVFLQQSGETSLAPVHRPLEPGSLPTQTLDRAFREDTSLIVMPVRLTGLYYDGGVPAGDLTFCFRYTMRGGDLKVPSGGQPAGFFDWPIQAGGLSPKYSLMVDDAVHHAGGPPILKAAEGGLSARLGRLFARQPVESDAEPWAVAVRLTGTASADAIEWAVEPDEKQPTAAIPTDPAKPPWETAARVLAHNHSVDRGSHLRLARVEMASERRALTLVFAAAAGRADFRRSGV